MSRNPQPYGIVHVQPDVEHSYGFYVVRKCFADVTKESIEIAVMHYSVPGVSSPTALDFYPPQAEANANAHMLSYMLNQTTSEASDAAA